MKIVHVETGRHFYGGAQQVVWLVSALSCEGIEGVLVCPPASDIDKVARQEGIRVENIECSGEHDLLFAWRLREFLRQENPDIVHCHSRRGADFLGGLAASMSGIPAVVSRRVDSEESPLLARLRYRPFRQIIAISENIASVLRKTNGDDDRVIVIRSAVDVDRINRAPDCGRFREEFELDDGDFTIAVIAQLIPRKGHRFLFDVVPNLRDLYPNLRIILFGTGPEEARLRALAKQLNLDGTVQFAGFRHDLDDYLGCFDLAVHPATEEGLGVAMLKAAAAGIAVVAFDVAGATEAVVHGKTGVLVAAGDVRVLQKAIALLIEEPEMRLEFGAAGRERMLEEFSLGRMVDSHIDLYKSVLSDVWGMNGSNKRVQMNKDESIFTLSEALVSELIAAGKSVSTAESCSGGWIAKSLTDIAGSSQCFGYGIVSYSNGAKESMLGVQPATLREHGAVSEAVVTEMASGVLNLSGADFAVAVSGVAGPDGGTGAKPVGTVWFGWAVRNGKNEALQARIHTLKGDREEIRSQTVILALQGLRERLRNSG